jgi:hypothetical protein
MTDTNQSMKDVLHVAVGLGILGLQRAQVCRRDLEQRLEPLVGEAGRRASATAQRLFEQALRVAGSR